MKEETKAGLQQKMRINKSQLDFYSRSDNRLKHCIDNPGEYHRFLDSIRERIKYLENQLKMFN